MFPGRRPIHAIIIHDSWGCETGDISFVVGFGGVVVTVASTGQRCLLKGQDTLPPLLCPVAMRAPGTLKIGFAKSLLSASSLERVLSHGCGDL